MPAKCNVLGGIAGSGKSAALKDLFRAALKGRRERPGPGDCLWLAPSNRVRDALRTELLDASLPAVFGPAILTFDDFAERILRSAPQIVRPLSGSMQRALLRRIITDLGEQGRLGHYASIAETPGFLDLVSSFIAELKRAETWPDDFDRACEARNSQPRDRDLAQIYRRYQDVLLTSQVYDAEGRFWSAREVLRNGQWGPFGELSLVVADGFTDFTHTQHEILELLAEKTGSIWLSLPLESTPARPDLFARTAGVVDMLRRSLDVSVQIQDPPAVREESPPAMAQLARYLFANPRHAPRSPDARGIEVIAVAGAAGEVRLLGARIKQWLLEGAAPDEIVVAVRDLDDYSPLFEELFDAAGIPYSCDARAPLARAPIAKALVNLLQLEVEDWPFRRLMSVLDAAHFRPNWSETAGDRAVRDVAATLRRFRLHEGRTAILNALERQAARDTAAGSVPGAPGSDRTGDDAAARRARDLLVKLSNATAPLRQKHDFERWTGIVAAIAAELGFHRAGEGNAVAREEQRAWDRLMATLYDAGRGMQLAGGDAPKSSLKTFLAELTDLLSIVAMPSTKRESGRVRILPAEEVRNLDVPFLFVAGLSERSFPRHRGDDCLYSEADRRELNGHGLSLGHRTTRAQEEMLMFYRVVTRARRRLVLTYPAVTREGEPLAPSPYLAAVHELFEKGALREQLEEQLDPVPGADRLLTASDARVRGMAEALENRPELLRAVCDWPPALRVADNLLAAADANWRRFHTRGFTGYEGLLENPRNVERLRRQFSRAHEFSATQLESYAECPFRFFLSQVLEVEPAGVPAVETDYRRRGTLVHDVLTELHRRLTGRPVAAGQPPAARQAEQIAALFHELLAERMGSGPRGNELHSALAHIEERLLREWGEAYGRQWDEYRSSFGDLFESPLEPTLLEAAFGTAAAREGEAPVSAASLVFGAGDNEVRVGGRIDRIDVGTTGGKRVFSVVDYKTGRRRQATIEQIAAGQALQLALYTLAVLRLELVGPGSVPWQMGYWHIRETGFVSGINRRKPKPGEPHPPLEASIWETLVRTLEDIVPRLASGIRAGRFPVYNADDQCTARCPYQTVCRVNQIRALPDEMDKTWEP